MKVREEIRRFEKELRRLGSSERAEGAKAYLKSDLDFAGVAVPDLRKVIGAWLKEHPELTRDELVRLGRELWRRRLHEHRGVAIILLQRRGGMLEAEDVALLESMLRRSFTWAYVDAIAVHVLGPLVERNPKLGRVIDRWAADDDFWIRRSALLALLLALRRGEGDWKRFVRYADSMIEEKEFFIRKAIGWVLREVAKKDPDRVYDFLRPRIGRVSGLTLREGAKYLPAAQRDQLFESIRFTSSSA
jgi:3-methyladenine DNA glycosylase AlkD